LSLDRIFAKEQDLKKKKQKKQKKEKVEKRGRWLIMGRTLREDDNTEKYVRV